MAGCEAQIDKDLARTFPELPLFASRGGAGQRQLRDVLRGFALLFPSVGYAQGPPRFADSAADTFPDSRLDALHLCFSQSWWPGFSSPRIALLLFHSVTGMNFVAATLLRHLPSEADAFFVFVGLMQLPRWRLRGVYGHGLPLLHAGLARLDAAVRARLPALHAHLERHGPVELFKKLCGTPELQRLHSYGLIAHIVSPFP